ncbi:MAG TPA: hypothetical protein VGD79_12300, partial [Thermoanaerobaculia bacterium]
NIENCSGYAFNIGGGPENTISLIELLALIRQFDGRAPRIERSAWRTGDQKYYVSDARRFQTLTGWKPRVDALDGIRRLREWLIDARIPALVQHAEEKPKRVAKTLSVVRDIPVASIPVSE